MRFFLLLPITLIAGCGTSEIPTAKDIKKELSVPFGDCKYFYIDNVEKTNGIPQQDGSYLVYSTFDVIIEPLEANKELAEAYHKKSSRLEGIYADKKKETEELEQKFSTQLEALKKEDETKKNLPDYDEFEYNDKYNVLSQWKYNEIDSLEVKYKKIIQNSNLPEHLDVSKVEAAQFQNIANECTQLKFKALSYLGNGDRLKMFSEGDKRSFEYQAYMIKTENGWMLSKQ